MPSVLDDYLSQIDNQELRAHIRGEFDKTTKDFGLVFERHQQEGIRMPKSPLEPGSKVVLEADDTFHHVVGIEGDTVTLVDRQGDLTTTLAGGVTVAREFGDVMFPGLNAVDEIRLGTSSDPVHTVISGENYHALEMLQYTHADKVDVIYIDPPYNTGNRTWKYNDKFVAQKDSYRHSKWLSFMEKRLLLARTLLNSTGVIIVAIDDNEHHRLRMLMDQIYGPKNFVSNVVWDGSRKNDSKLVSNGTDYMLIYARDVEAMRAAEVQWREPRESLDEMLEAGVEAWSASQGDPAAATLLMKKWISALPEDHPAKDNNRFYEFENSGRVFRKKDISWPGGGGPTYDVLHPETGLPVRVPSRGWIYSKPERMQEDIDNGSIMWGKDHTQFINRKTYLDSGEGVVPTSVFERKRTSAGKHVENVLGSSDFPFPKDVDVIARWIRLATTGKQNAIVLDFFGGTGTTAEAVMRLNAEDGGARQCILITNNELSASDDRKLRKAGFGPGDDEFEGLGVFRHVTKPRIQTVVTGMRADGSKYSNGMAANVVFFHLEYLDRARVKYGHEFDSLAGLFWLRAGAIGPIVKRETLNQGFVVSPDAAIAVLFRPGSAAQLAGLLRETVHANLSHVFIVTDSDEQGNIAAGYFDPAVTVERIYGSYLSAFQINKKD
jgi:adenine-specific DNA-methyltransferase